MSCLPFESYAVTVRFSGVPTDDKFDYFCESHSMCFVVATDGSYTESFSLTYSVSFDAAVEHALRLLFDDDGLVQTEHKLATVSVKIFDE